MKNDWLSYTIYFLSAVVVAVIASALVGCVTMTVTAPDGAVFKRTAFGINPQIGVMTVEKRADNSYKLTVRGLDSNSTDAVAAIVQGAVQGVTAGMKP